jgi:uncharacterized membrane protein YGL010W
MRKIDQLLAEYAESHQNPTNKTIHWICVPIIFMCVLALFWAIPHPEFFNELPIPMNFGILAMLIALLYYVFLSIPLTIGMLFIASVFLGIISKIDQIEILPLWAIALIFFVLAWIGQFYGHNIEGKKPSFLKDLQFLLIGPVWLLSFIYKNLGIKI